MTPCIAPIWFVHAGHTKFSQELSSILNSASISAVKMEPQDVRGTWQTVRPRMVLLGAAPDAAYEGLELLRWLRQRDIQLPLFIFVTQSSEDLAIAALRAGVTDFFRWPWRGSEIVVSIRKGSSHLQESQDAMAGVERTAGADEAEIVGASAHMEHIRQQVRLAAFSDCNVLVTGETGTGKALVANLIHKQSSRSMNRFVCLNCAAIPEGLLESELFGYNRGAFTGATAAKSGRLVHADHGTIFLDEIGDMTPSAQAKLLRAIESRQIQRLGDTREIKIDVRVVAATNQNLEQHMESGQFRRDLYYRLNVFRLELPPLREHPQDIPLLVKQFVDSWNRSSNRQTEGLTDEAVQDLLPHNWPGNVRELRNVLESILVSSFSPRASISDFPLAFRKLLGESTNTGHSEREKLLSALLATNWNKSRAAASLNWSRMTVYRKLARYRLDPKCLGGSLSSGGGLSKSL